MIREGCNALAACLVTMIIFSGAYPLVVWGLAQLAFPHQAQGSLIVDGKGVVVGSSLVAQPFASNRYFHPRPSSVEYNASAAGGSNLGTNNPALRDKVADRAKAIGGSTPGPAPVDLLTSSGSGLDPDISPEGARYQAARVAEARRLPVERILALIEERIERSAMSLIGAPARINVLLLNRALDAEKPTPGSALVTAPVSSINKE